MDMCGFPSIATHFKLHRAHVFAERLQCVNKALTGLQPSVSPACVQTTDLDKRLIALFHTEPHALVLPTSMDLAKGKR